MKKRSFRQLRNKKIIRCSIKIIDINPRKNFRMTKENWKLKISLTPPLAQISPPRAGAGLCPAPHIS